MFRCFQCREIQPPRTKSYRVVTQVEVTFLPDRGPSVQIKKEADHCFACAVLVCRILPSRLEGMGSILRADVRADAARQRIGLDRYYDLDREVALLGLPTEQDLRARMIDATAAA